MSYDGNTLVVTASGPTAPDKGVALSDLLHQRFGTTIPISLVWTKTPSPSPSSTSSASTDPDVAIARTTSDAWIVSHPGIAVLGINRTPTGLTLTLIGNLQPTVDDLRAQLEAALPQLTITVEWVNETVLGQPSPTPAPTLTPTPEVSSPLTPSPPPTAQSSG